ncbi:MAG: penicillin-binding protein 1C [Candidatus Nitronauta litoralis]|uniref:peptidoglycan glycosyltransferase n=1 Tax=Candidatus Nitronauta litoralis TaxID=2705533 RepID=A0A7T0BZS2_9BACT|nr:MAG: penicillin-binding protein 1C [Candidatus Nitronauta litoralis]
MCLLLFLALGTVYFFLPKPNLMDGVGYSSTYYDRHGKLLRLTLAPDEIYRVRLSLGDIAPGLIEATLLQEDRYFFEHPGVNPFSLMRAFYETYIKRNRRVGGSTLTMQLARMRFKIDSYTIPGKLVQIFRALQLERHYEKEEILEAYLNLAPYGGNIEGVGAASLIYYHRPAYELSLAETLALSIVPQNPSKRNPLKGSGNTELVKARSRLFDAWIKKHPEDKGQHALLELPLQVYSPSRLPFYSPHFLENILSPSLGRVETQLDSKLQVRLEAVLKGYVERRRPLGVRNASAIMVDFRDMSVRALVGSANYFDASIDGAVDGTRGKRSPGSTLKPFIYGLALEQGIIHPKTLLKDAPSRFADYRPENFDGRFRGPLHARDALVMSRNIPALYLASRLQRPDLYSFLKTAGVRKMETREHYGLALVLGGGEVTMQELVRLYAMLANQGELKPLRFLKNAPTASGKSLLSPEAAYLTLAMLRDNPIATRHSFIGQNVKRLPVYWKTGTSNGFKDAWAVGLFGHYALAVWLGNFDGTPNPEFIGGSLAAPLFFDIVDAVQETEHLVDEIQSRKKFLNISKVELCSETGDLADELCPRTEWGDFIPGKSPIRNSGIFRKVAIDPDSGYRACTSDPTKVEYEVYEFWPSDLLSVFKKAGISRRTPPPFLVSCERDRQSAQHLKPRITSPRAGVEYAITLGRPDLSLPLMVTTDSEVRSVYWFANEEFLGRNDGTEPLEWNPQPGEFTLRAVDDSGASDSRTIKIGVVQ